MVSYQQSFLFACKLEVCAKGLLQFVDEQSQGLENVYMCLYLFVKSRSRLEVVLISESEDCSPPRPVIRVLLVIACVFADQSVQWRITQPRHGLKGQAHRHIDSYPSAVTWHSSCFACYTSHEGGYPAQRCQPRLRLHCQRG